ncbi:condensation domain-containing protein [Nonomuraea sp. B1E8]|uniref:condensation domain-containing protein n=1 Tax=unclassified Nonomuraea TaxID=2593643 RepID=UPI00325E9703
MAEPVGAPLTAPLTWGQQDIWRAVLAAEPQDHYLTIGRVFDAPRKRPVTVERAAQALDRLVARHESLRTRLTGPRDAPLQLIFPEARPAFEVTGDEPAQQVCDRLAAVPFRYAEEWPLRVAFVTEGGHVRQVVLVLSHLAADGHAADLVAKDFRLLLLRDSLPPPQGPVPRELAAWQGSAEGLRLSRETIAAWLAEHARLDPVPPPSHPPDRPRFVEVTLRSPALDGAAQDVAARNRVSSSTVLLAAAMRLAGGLTGQRFHGMRVIVNNRFAAGRRDVVGTISQEALVVLDLRTESFDALVRQAWGSALRAYRLAQYDPRAMAEAVGAAGPGIRSFGCFNDQRLVQEDGAPRASVPGVTEVTRTDAMDRNICDFRVHVGGEPGRMEVSCYADTALLPPPDAERYLLDLEKLVVGEARS